MALYPRLEQGSLRSDQGCLRILVSAAPAAPHLYRYFVCGLH